MSLFRSMNRDWTAQRLGLSQLLGVTQLLGLALLVGGCLLDSRSAFAQITANYATEGEPEQEGIELLQTEPYDLIRFTERSGGGWAKVMPIDFPGRKIPRDPKGTLAVSVLGLPGKTYEAQWTSIESIELWEDRLLKEAERLMAAGEFGAAYPFLSVLYRDNPNLPKVGELRKEYLLKNAAAEYTDGDARKTLAILESLRAFAPEYRTDQVLRAISQITDRLMQSMQDAGRLQDAQQLLARLKEDYRPEEVESIPIWDAKFLKLAEEKREEALAARDANRWREARRLALDSYHLYPAIPGGRELVREIEQAYPLVNVGVLQTATVLDPTRIDNWPARRSGSLVYRALFEMRNAGSEGGEYEFLFGDSSQSPDRLELNLEFRPERLEGPLSAISSFSVADRLTSLALRDSSDYRPAWAGVVDSLAVPGPKRLDIFLRRPHVLPQSLLQVKVDGSWVGLPENSPTGAYRVADEQYEEGVTRYLLAEDLPYEGGRPREVAEVQQDDAAGGVASLLRGDLDVLDHLFPADAARLRDAPNIRVENYPLPTVHLLIPTSDHPYLSERTFRRALVYGINRQDILKGELLGNTSLPGCRVISGPFPAGVTPDDPLAYAYDESIAARTYQPRLAKLLSTMTEQRLKGEADRAKTTPPELTPLRIAHPQDDLARIACQAIKQQLTMLEIPVELVELPTGVSQPEAGTADLVYMTVALWEPITDARRVLGPEGLAHSQDQLIGLGLRRLESARNWREVRERLFDLHSIVHHELPVIPLWQLVDSYAYRSELSGVGTNIVSLYQNVDRWRLAR
ncbi:ABC transporter substrate-binding protein [Candidatus Laterigemmans baculatus]|uniref:ABC transporter substrate-binding protein n=1 Tax=Candidatus Laterigemmans baculatus TaxID=2770505 RepID=UPI001F1BCAB1|nr:ABC transporter substrate-binding protein [Candidatus Laterigemmans baculatus]